MKRIKIDPDDAARIRAIPFRPGDTVRDSTLQLCLVVKWEWVNDRDVKGRSLRAWLRPLIFYNHDGAWDYLEEPELVTLANDVVVINAFRRRRDKKSKAHP